MVVVRVEPSSSERVWVLGETSASGSFAETVMVAEGVSASIVAE